MKKIVIKTIILFASIMFVEGTLGLKTGEKLSIEELFSVQNLLITFIYAIIGALLYEFFYKE
mgnify:CR=1 FL=1